MKFSTNAAIGGLTEFAQDGSPTYRANNGFGKEEGPSPLAKIWQALSNETIIPYDLNLRRTRFEKAYKLLAPLIEYYELQKERSDRSNLPAAPPMPSSAEDDGAFDCD